MQRDWVKDLYGVLFGSDTEESVMRHQPESLRIDIQGTSTNTSYRGMSRNQELLDDVRRRDDELISDNEICI